MPATPTTTMTKTRSRPDGTAIRTILSRPRAEQSQHRGERQMRPAAPPPLPGSAPPSPASGAGPVRQRRAHVRVDLRMSAEIRTARGAFTATTRDLSEGGAGLDPERPLEEGEEVALGLFLVVDDVESDVPPLWVKARVA